MVHFGGSHHNNDNDIKEENRLFLLNEKNLNCNLYIYFNFRYVSIINIIEKPNKNNEKVNLHGFRNYDWLK